MKKVIKGISWDHPRGYKPLRAASQRWMEQNPDLELKWDVRTLKEFGDYPLEKLIETYDMILVDHPFMGEAADKEILIKLDQFLSPEFISVQQQESVGSSFESYCYGGHHYALPIDAAAQVSAFRYDLLQELGLETPNALEQVEEFCQQLPKEKYVAIPLCPTDIWCVYLSLSAQFTADDIFNKQGVKPDAGRFAVEQIKSWLSFIHPKSLKMNPISLLNSMSSNNEIVYSPFLFGYTNYSRMGYNEHLVNFGNVPRFENSKKSSLLGGVGIAISANSDYRVEALDFVQYVLSPEIQKGLYYKYGGQPAHLTAWKDKANNEDCSNFFLDTLCTLQNAYVRPRHKGFNRFQENAAEILHGAICEGMESSKIVEKINSLHQNLHE